MLQERKVRRNRVQSHGSLRTLRLSTSICGANERANYMAPTKRQHDLTNADKVSMMRIVAGASTYDMRTPVCIKRLVREDEYVGFDTGG